MEARLKYAIQFVADMDAAVAFWRDAFGLKVRFATPEWTELETGEVTLALHPANAANPAGGVQLGFATENLAQLYAERAVNGLAFVAPPHLEHGTLLGQVVGSEGANVSLSSKP